jgi:hypothetical protein
MAAVDRMEPAFEQYRRELNDAALPATLSAHFHYYLAVGYQMFGREEDSRAEFERAIAIASANNMNQVVINAEKGLESLQSCAVVPSHVTHETPSPEVARVADAISEMRVLAGIGS